MTGWRFAGLRTSVAMTAFLLILCIQDALAGVECMQVDDRIRRCNAGPGVDLMRKAVQPQMYSQWCWAASIATVLSHLGMPVTQREIVQAVDADLTNRGVEGPVISDILHAAWQRRPAGSTIRQPRVADAAVGRADVDLAAVVEALAIGRPLIVGAGNHAMVLVQVGYEVDVETARFTVTSAVVFDPMPQAGFRPLKRDEMRLTYVALL